MAIEFPANPSDSDSFVANNVTYIYDGTLGVWNIYSGTTYNGGLSGGGASVTIGDSAPTSPSNGDMWWESDVGRLKIYYDDGDTAQWVDATPTSNTVGGTNTVIAPFALAHITQNNYTTGTGTGISWGTYVYDAGNGDGYYDFTFTNARSDAEYTVVTDMGYAGDANISPEVTNRTTTGFRVNFYNDSTGNPLTEGSAITNEPIVFVFDSTPTQTIQTNPYTDGNVDTHLNVSSATTGEVLSWTGTDYDWVTAASGGASVTTSDTAPSNPSEGDLWFDTTELTTYVYYNDGNSSQWVNSSPNGMSASLNISDTAPTNPSVGDLWFDSTVLKTFVYYNDGSSSQWVTLVPTVGSSSSTPAIDSDSTVNESPIVLTEPPTTHTLNSDGSTSTVTMVAEDPEGFDITYGIAYKTSGNTRPAQLAADTTVDANGVYTFTPTTTEANAGTFTARLSATDGVSITTRFVDFTLEFIKSYRYIKVIINSVQDGGTQAQITEISIADSAQTTAQVTAASFTSWSGTVSTDPNTYLNTNTTGTSSYHTNLTGMPFTLEIDLGATYDVGTGIKYLQVGTSDDAARFPNSVTVYGANASDYSDEEIIVENAAVPAYDAVRAMKLVDLAP